MNSESKKNEGLLVLSSREQLKAHARVLPFDERAQIILSFAELPLQQHLSELYKAMEPSYIVEVTQGPKELGKDLVLIKSDKVTTDVIGVVVKCGDVRHWAKSTKS
jgi:hypothetical protein